MPQVNNFDVLKAMATRNLDVRLATLDNIIKLKKVRAGTQVTIGVAGDLVAALGLENKFVGGLILADKEQFDKVAAELQRTLDDDPAAGINKELDSVLLSPELLSAEQRDYLLRLIGLKNLTEEQRVSVFSDLLSRYCRHCGRDLAGESGDCSCWSDSY